MMSRPTHRRFRRFRFAGAAAFIVVMSLWLGSLPVHAEHPAQLIDYSPGSRIAFEAAGGHLKLPLPATTLHYLLRADIDLTSGLHLRLGAPFSSYTGAQGADSFIRGNLLAGLSFSLPLTDWMGLGFTWDFYFPTYQKAGLKSVNLPQDPRRAVLTHYHYHLAYAMADRFPIAPSVALRMQTAGFYTQAEVGAIYAPAVRKSAPYKRRTQLGLVTYGAALGYSLFDVVEAGVAFTGLLDTETRAPNLKDVLGLLYKAPRSLHACTFDLRFQYAWAVLRLNATLPLEAGYRERLDTVYGGSFEVQF